MPLHTRAVEGVWDTCRTMKPVNYKTTHITTMKTGKSYRNISALRNCSNNFASSQEVRSDDGCHTHSCVSSQNWNQDAVSLA